MSASNPASLSPFFDLATELTHLPEDIQATILEVQEKAGFIPNVFLMLAARPDEFRAFFAYYNALMEKESETLTLAEKEMLVVATSSRNQCLYCVVAHGAMLRVFSKQPLLADQLAVNHTTAPLSKRHRLMLDFGLHLGVEAKPLTKKWVKKLEKVGFTRNDIWDIGAVCSFFALSNRMVALTGTPPNDEFYLLGRLPREK